MNNIVICLKLPPYFRYILSKNKDYIDINNLLKIYKRYKISDISYIISRTSIVNKELKLFYLLFLHKLLDKKEYNDLLSNNKNYKQFIIRRINKIKNNIRTSLRNGSKIDERINNGLEYIDKNFVYNKRYFYINNNSKYYKKLLSIYLKTILYTLKWYRETLEIRYRPGGRGYIEARDRFLNY